MTLLAINTYNVTFIVDGKNSINTMYCGEKIITPDNPQKNGYTFIGWMPNIEKNIPAHDVTYTAQFIANSYVVKFVVDNIIISEVTQEYGTPITVPMVKDKIGYTFWGVNDVPATLPPHDVTFTGTFSVNYYRLTYIFDNEIYAEDSIAYGSTIIPREVNVSGEIIFNNWEGIPEIMPAENITVYGNTIITSITNINEDSKNVDIYSINGRLIKQQADISNF